MTELKLTDELIHQMGVNVDDVKGCKEVEYSFDEAGTLHILYRDEEGALLKDSPLCNKTADGQGASNDNSERLEEIEELRKQSRIISRFVTFLGAMILLSILAAGYILLKMR